MYSRPPFKNTLKARRKSFFDIDFVQSVAGISGVKNGEK
jgi:hypothetical protein